MGEEMFYHRKELFRPVSVGTPDAQFPGNIFWSNSEVLRGELTAALQYWVQSFHAENAAIRDLLQDIAIEEFSHLEMVGKLIAQHTSKIDQTKVYEAPLFAMKGIGPHFVDSQGSCAGPPLISTKAGMWCAICARTLRLKPARGKPMKH